MNKLYYGDNLEVLRDKIPDKSVDLIYLDPPFQSGKNYNIIFDNKRKEVKGVTAQIQAFEDTWEWGLEAEKEYFGLVQDTITKERPSGRLIELMKAMRGYLNESPMMAYLAMMAPRLLELKRVLKDIGSIYLHCDPTASHYLKLLMDAVFGPRNFRNEIIWCYKRFPSKQDDFQQMHDVILRYSKSKNVIWNKLYDDFTEQTKKRIKGGMKIEHVIGKSGKILIRPTREKSPGVAMCDYWNIPMIAGQAKERIGYPTQKPEALLERIIKASSNEGDLLLDPFCGCGTAVAVAQKLNRKWIGIDITYLAIDIIEKRLAKSDLKEGKDFKIEGAPADEYSAEKLAESNPFQFQYWAVSRIPGGIPNERKTGDKGIDGFIYFTDISKPDKTGKAIISVKGGKNVNPGMVRDLVGTIQSNSADFGILVTLPEPTANMKTEAAKQGYFQYVRMQIPKVQILSVKDLFTKPLLPVILPESIMPAYNMKRIKPKEDTLPLEEEEKE
jgi:site-specific DNA-methyltransferase (adenine-specific)